MLIAEYNTEVLKIRSGQDKSGHANLHILTRVWFDDTDRPRPLLPGYTKLLRYMNGCDDQYSAV